MTERSPKIHLGGMQSGIRERPANTEKGKPIRVLIADEHPVVCEGLAAMFSKQSDIQLVSQLQNVAAVLQQYDAFLPDILLFDLEPTMFESVRAIFAILEEHPAAKILVFSASHSEEHIYQAMHAGASGYLLKTSTVEQILAAIRSVYRGENWVPQPIAEALVRRMASPQLTRRELEVLTAMTEGKSNREIGEALKVSEGTVKVHMTHILEKLQVDGRTGAMAAAAARGLVTLVARPTLKDSHGVNESKPTDSARRNFRDPSNGNLARVS